MICFKLLTVPKLRFWQTKTNTINVKFSPLEIMYDGNTIRLTPKQLMSALDPTVIQSIGKSLAGLKVTTPEG